MVARGAIPPVLIHLHDHLNSNFIPFRGNVFRSISILPNSCEKFTEYDDKLDQRHPAFRPVASNADGVVPDVEDCAVVEFASPAIAAPTGSVLSDFREESVSDQFSCSPRPIAK